MATSSNSQIQIQISKREQELFIEHLVWEQKREMRNKIPESVLKAKTYFSLKKASQDKFWALMKAGAFNTEKKPQQFYT